MPHRTHYRRDYEQVAYNPDLHWSIKRLAAAISRSISLLETLLSRHKLIRLWVINRSRRSDPAVVIPISEVRRLALILYGNHGAIEFCHRHGLGSPLTSPTIAHLHGAAFDQWAEG